MFYLYLSLFYLIISFLEYINKSRKILLICSLGVFIFVSGFRYQTGLDWIGYTSYFQRNSFEILQIKNIEFGYKLLMIIFKNLKLNYYSMQFFISLITSFSIYNFYKNNSKYPLFCIYLYINLYYLRYNMGLQRQIISISLCLIAYEFYKNNKKFLTFFLLILSLFFHFSSIIFIIVFYLSKYIKIKLNFQIIIMLIFFILAVFKIDLVSYILKFALLFTEKLHINYIANKIQFYLNSEFYSFKIGITKTFIGQFIIILLIFILRKPKTLLEEKVYFFTMIYVVISSFSSSFYVLDRLQSYFGLFSLILISYIMDLFKKNTLLFLGIGIYFLFPIINFTLRTETRYYMRYVPYYSIFYKINDENRFKAEKGLIGK